MPAKTSGALTLSPLYFLVSRSCMLGSLAIPFTAFAEPDMWFNPDALTGAAGNVQIADLSAFNSGEQPPGTYQADIYVNGDYIDSESVKFVSQNKKLVPQLTAAYWRGLGLKSDYSAPLTALPGDTVISEPGKYIAGIATKFDYNRMRLDISIPQAALQFRARDYVDPSRWDDGVPAALLNYSANYSTNQNKESGTDYSNLFMRFDSGLNLGGWRLRNNSTFTRNTGEQPYYDINGNRIVRQKTETSWNSLNTYAFHDIAALEARLTLGDSYTPGDLFDSIQYRGVQLTSDDNMLPDSLRGFAPVVRGVARTNAIITVRQNGSVIYKTNVAPGPFEIHDIYPTASSGNLDVTVEEANGTQTRFVQPFSAVPGMLREGRFRFSGTAGKYRSWSDNVREPEFFQGTAQYGIKDGTTLYGGIIGSSDYKSGLLGVGQGLGNLGSVSLDVTYASTQLDDGPSRSGQSWRAQYSKDIFQSGTSFVLAGYRYSTDGYYDFNEAAQSLPAGSAYDNDNPYDYWRRTHTKRNRLQVQVNQNMGEYGSMFLSAYKQDYWGGDGSERTLSLGYSLTLNNISYSLNLSDSRYPQFKADRSAYFSVSVPLDQWLGHNVRTSYALYSDNKGRTRNQLGVGGNAFENDSLNWNVQEGWANKGEGNSGSVGASWDAALGRLNGGYSYDRYGRQFTAGVAGGVIAHPYGVTLSQPIGSTAVLVRAPGAAGVDIQNKQGVKTDWRGYTVAPYATPYRRNNVSINTASLPNNVEIEQTSVNVIPTYGALVLADFKPNIGSRVLATASYKGRPIPFGATAKVVPEFDNAPDNSSIVGDGGEVYLSGISEKGSVVKLSWGKGADEQCQGVVKLNPSDAAERVRNGSLICR